MRACSRAVSVRSSRRYGELGIVDRNFEPVDDHQKQKPYEGSAGSVIHSKREDEGTYGMGKVWAGSPIAPATFCYRAKERQDFGGDADYNNQLRSKQGMWRRILWKRA